MRAWSEFVVRRRFWLIALALSVTAALASQIGRLRIEIDPNRFLPQSHPYVVTSNRVESIFGSKYVLVIGLTPAKGDIYQPQILAKVERITQGLRTVPGVLKNSILSFSARKAKSITGTDAGMEVRPLMEHVPQNAAELEALRRHVESNPAYLETLVSADRRSIAVVAEFTDNPKGMRATLEQVTPLVAAERDGGVTIAMSGIINLLGHLELYSERMGILLPLAMLLIGGVLWFAFRSVQGLFLPLTTAVFAVLWSLGIMSLFHVPLDVFNATTPILILAVAAGHAVQILKRYYEEYARLAGAGAADVRELSRRAVVESLTHVGPVMVTAGVVAALGFLSLLVFEISSIRTFGVFSACGILSSLLLEMTLIPALRATMRPPKVPAAAGRAGRVERAMELVANLVTGPRAYRVALAALAVLGVAAVGVTQLRYEESIREFFSADLQVIKDDTQLNRSFAGTNALYVMIEAPAPGRMQDPDVLSAIDGMQKYLAAQPNVGKSLSIADFMRRMNKAMNGDDPAHDAIPPTRELAAQYLLMYSNSGDPGDFDTYVDYDYQRANIWVFLKEHRTDALRELVPRLKSYAQRTFPADVTVSFGGNVAQGTAIHEVIAHTKLLNMLQIAAVVLVLTTLVFRSWIAGLLVLIPVTASVAVNFGLMGWTGIPFNVPNSITSAMIVGIGADYVIYFLYRLREERALASAPEEAIRRTLASAGSAIVFVAAAVAVGYSVLLLSRGFYAHIWMGILICTAMLVSAAAALTLVPALISLWKPKFALRPMPAAAAVLLGVLGALGAQDGRGQSGLGAEEIMRRNYMVDKVVGSQSRAVLRLRNKAGQERVRESVSTTKLQANDVDNQRIVRFELPADVKGTAILLVEHARADDDIWIYLPALRKVRRLVASNKKDSFAGTDFSYGDVIGHAVDDWRHSLVGEETVDGERCFIVESTPLDAAVRATSGYSKRRSAVSASRFVLVRMQAWDTEGQLLKEAQFGDFRNVDPAHDKWIAMRARARNVQTGHSTDITFKDYRLLESVADELFSTRSLEFGS